jgi:endonuclease/exonuclease/phosphatase family metal-dependent hydrolase
MEFSAGMKGMVAGILCWLMAEVAMAAPQPVRVVAANLTSGNHQTYSPDNGNHSDPEGAGARILKGLRPDVALVQEFNPTVPLRQWVNATFGEEFAVFVEPTGQAGGIPNGIVSRWPIVASGEWDDVSQTNREFAWAKIALPDGRFLWAISVHLYSKKPAVRAAEAKALVKFVREKIPDGDLVVLGGDFNTREREETCVAVFAGMFDAKRNPPTDAMGDGDTNAPRNKPYDWVLADRDLAVDAVPTRIGAAEFPQGLVFDSRSFRPLADVAPVQAGDSAAPNMQHMAVVRDFLVK